jgi:hypothetical protein
MAPSKCIDNKLKGEVMQEGDSGLLIKLKEEISKLDFLLGLIVIY